MKNIMVKSDIEILETAKQTIRTEVVCIENLLNHVDEEHLPRFNTPLFPDSGFRHRNGARFAGENHLIIVRQQEPRRTQSVAIKRRPDLHPVGENNGGRPMPWNFW